MTKQDFITIFANNPNKNFIITTNVNVGMGLKGKNNMSYCGYHIINTTEQDNYTKTQILGVTDDCVVLGIDNKTNDYWRNGKKTVFIPFDNIVMIEILDDGCKSYKGIYPNEIKTKNYLTNYF